MAENSLENQNTPLVSIIIPFYNREEFLAEAIESVLAQTEQDWELLLINDGSTDESFNIAGSFVKKYPSKIYLLGHENNQNKGASTSRNLGIAHARGEYLTFLDSDDVFFPDTLQKELEAFDKNPEADTVCGTLECWFSWSSETEKRDRDFIIDLIVETEKLYQPPDLLVHNLSAGGRKPGINCVMMKRDFSKRFKLFEDDYRYVGEDQVFWAKVSLYGKIYVMDAVLAKYRQHPASTCAVESETGRDIASVKIFLDWLETYLQKEKIENKTVWKALHGFQRSIYLETKFKGLKQIYRRLFPLHLRYKIRDKWTKAKKKHT